MIARWPSSSRKSHGASGQSSGQHPNTRHPRAPDPAPAFRTRGPGPRRHRYSPQEAIDIVYTPAREERTQPTALRPKRSRRPAPSGTERAPRPGAERTTHPGTERAARPRHGLGPCRHRYSPQEAIDIVYTPAREEHSPPPFAQNDRGGPPRAGQNVHHARGQKEPPTRGQNERPARAPGWAPPRTRGREMPGDEQNPRTTAPPGTRCREPVECGARHPDTRTPRAPGTGPGARVGGAGGPGHPRAPGTSGTRDPRNTARPGAVETRIRRKARP